MGPVSQGSLQTSSAQVTCFPTSLRGGGEGPSLVLGEPANQNPLARAHAHTRAHTRAYTRTLERARARARMHTLEQKVRLPLAG